MATKRSKKPSKPELLQSEVASFASSLGFATSSFAPSSGFDDSDFRKSGPLKPHRSPQPRQKAAKDPNLNPSTAAKARRRAPKPKRSPLDQIDPFEAIGKRKGGGFPLMKASSLSRQWYEDAEGLERKVLGKDGGKDFGKVVGEKGLEELKKVVERKKEVAEKLMRQYTEDYHAGMRKSKDMHMVETAVKSGTTADKVSALTCLIEDNPVANLKSLDSLLHMVTVKVGKRYAFASFDALKELFMCRFLPERKLKSLLQRPLDYLPDSKDGYSLLLFWYWEECLKQRYEQFVIALADASKDLLPSLKDKAVKLMYLLLCGKPEQERRLLSALVNKLGDPVRKSASGAGYYLSCLLSAHPNMKAVVIDEVDSFIFRPNVGLRAKYHAINFLSQIFLSKTGDGPKLAKRLVDVYFALFTLLISENSQNRKVNKFGNKKIDTKVRRLNEKRKHSRKEAKGGSSDSFFEMDCRLLSAILTGVNRAFPYIASEEIDDLMEVQTPILFKLAHSKNFNVSVQALMLLYQISSKNQIASDRFYRALYSILLTPAALNSSKPELFLGLLAKALKNDININRIAAFAKRILQVCLLQPSQYACGCLFLLSEVLKARPPLWNMMLQKESVDDDDVEHFEDVIEDSIGGEDIPQLNSSNKIDVTVEGKSNDHEENDKDHNQTPIASLPPAGYDPRHREPSYCKADLSSWWELSVLASHVHPSVATMSRTLLSGANIVYNGDPLNDLSLASFLDKFVEKKPKQNQRSDGVWHGGSQIAPTRKLDMGHHLIGEQIVQLEEEDVPPEDIIFHKFYMNKTRNGGMKLKKKKTGDDEDDFVMGSDESDDNDEIDEMLGADLLPSGEADGEYEYDDLEDAVLEDEDDLLGGDEQADAIIDPRGDLGFDDDGDSDVDADDDIEGNVKMDREADFDEDVSQEQTQKAGKKRNSGKKRNATWLKKSSPFADLGDFEHLMDDGSKASKQHRSKKKKR